MVGGAGVGAGWLLLVVFAKFIVARFHTWEIISTKIQVVCLILLVVYIIKISMYELV